MWLYGGQLDFNQLVLDMFFDLLNDDLQQAIHDQISNIKISHNKTDRYKMYNNVYCIVMIRNYSYKLKE